MSKAWVSILSVVVSIAVGIGLYFIWQDARPDDEWYMPTFAAIVGIITVYVLLYKIRGGS